MAIFNEILAGRYNRLMQKLFSMKGNPPAPQLASELQMQLSMFYGNENRFLEDWNLYAMRFLVGLVAAQFGAVRLRNPASSGFVAVVTKIVVENTVSHEFLLQGGAFTADLVAIATMLNQAMDLRSKPQPGLIASTTTLAALPTAPLFMGGAVLAGGTTDLITTSAQEIPILPGGGLTIIDSTANQNFSTSFWWRERGLEDSEKQ